MSPVYTFLGYQFDEASYSRNVREHNGERKHPTTHRFGVTPYSEEQRLCFGQTVGVDEFPVIEPETSPEVVH